MKMKYLIIMKKKLIIIKKMKYQRKMLMKIMKILII